MFKANSKVVKDCITDNTFLQCG